MVFGEGAVHLQQLFEIREVVANVVNCYLIAFYIVLDLLLDILPDLRVLQLVFWVAFTKILLEFVNVQLNLTLRTIQDEIDDLMEAITEFLILTEQTRDLLRGPLDAFLRVRDQPLFVLV